MYRSVGKFWRSLTITRRDGDSAFTVREAALRTLYRFTEVESAATHSPGRAPTSAPMRSPTRCGSVIQPASFQLRIRPSPHSCRTAAATRAGVARGNAPRELPST